MSHRRQRLHRWWRRAMLSTTILCLDDKRYCCKRKNRCSFRVNTVSHQTIICPAKRTNGYLQFRAHTRLRRFSVSRYRGIKTLPIYICFVFRLTFFYNLQSVQRNCIIILNTSSHGSWFICSLSFSSRLSSIIINCRVVRIRRVCAHHIQPSHCWTVNGAASTNIFIKLHV